MLVSRPALYSGCGVDQVLLDGMASEAVTVDRAIVDVRKDGLYCRGA